MSMLSIDTYAYTNRLKHAHPMGKSLFALMTLLTCMAFQEMVLYLFVIVSMTLLVVAVAGIPVRFYARALTLPLPFVLMGVVTVIVDVSRTPSVFDFYVQLFSVFFGVTRRSIDFGTIVFFRTYACVCCLYFLSLTTPIIDITWVLRKIRVPAVFVELFSMIYRFIFELLDAALLIKTSQESRLGYADLKRSYRSLGLLISNVFIKCFQNYKNLSIAMQSRLYQGDFKVIEERYTFSTRHAVFIGAYFITMGCLIAVKRFGG